MRQEAKQEEEGGGGDGSLHSGKHTDMEDRSMSIQRKPAGYLILRHDTSDPLGPVPIRILQEGAQDFAARLQAAVE